MSSVVKNVRTSSSGILGTPRRRVLWGFTGLLAVAGAVILPSVDAKDPPSSKDAATQSRSTLPTPGAREGARSEMAAIPECFEKLKLSAEQQTQIRDICQNYDESLGTVWKQFGDRYMQAIVMESSLLAAIEDNLTEPQRQQVRDQRHKTARYEKSVAATNTKVNQATAKPGEETTRPESAVEAGLAAVEVSLTPEQEEAADKVQEKYRTQLRSLNRDIQGLHTRLVSLEADKLVEIEKVLTKDQLAQLREHRQAAPTAPKLIGTRVSPSRTE